MPCEGCDELIAARLVYLPHPSGVVGEVPVAHEFGQHHLVELGGGTVDQRAPGDEGWDQMLEHDEVGDTHEGNATARRLYDDVALHSGFIVYRKDLA